MNTDDEDRMFINDNEKWSAAWHVREAENEILLRPDSANTHALIAIAKALIWMADADT